MSAGSSAPAQSRLFLKQFRQVSFFQLINSASAFLVNILVARMLGPKAFGDFFFFVSTAVVSTILFDFGLTRTLLRYSSFHQARGEMEVKLGYYAAVLRLKFWLGLGMLVVGVGIGFLLPFAMRFCFIWGLITGFIISHCQYLSAVAQTENNYSAYNLVLSFNTLRLIGVGILIFLGLVSPGRIYLVFIAAPLLLATWPTWRLGRDLSRARQVGEHDFYGRIIRFGKWMIALAMLETLYQRLDIMCLRFLAGPEAAGHYSGALAFFGVVYLLPAYVAVLVYPRLVEAVGRRDEQAFIRHYRFSTDMIALLGIPLALGLWAISPDLLTHFLGADYRAASPVFVYLALYALLWSCQINAGAVFFAKDAPHLAAIAVLAALAVSLGLNLWLIPQAGIVGAGIAVMTAMAVSLTFYWGMMKMKFNLSPRLVHLGVYLLSGIIMATVVRTLPFAGLWGMALKIVVGAVAFAGTVLLCHFMLPGGCLPEDLGARRRVMEAKR